MRRGAQMNNQNQRPRASSDPRYAQNSASSGRPMPRGFSQGGAARSSANPQPRRAYPDDFRRPAGSQPPRRPANNQRPYGQSSYVRPERPASGSGYANAQRRPAPGEYSRYNEAPRRPVNPQPRQQAPRYEQQVRRSAPQPQRQPVRREKKGDNILVKILKGILMVFMVIFGGIGKLFSAFSRLFDRFRKDETSTAIVNCLLGGALVVVLLCVFMIFRSDIDCARARSLAASGKSSQAVQIISRLEDRGFKPEKLEKTRIGVVEKLSSAGNFEAAADLAQDVSDAAVKEELLRGNSYTQAAARYKDGEYAEAAQLFYQLNDYKDASLRYADCRCALAIQAWQGGDEAAARSLMLDVPDLANRIASAASLVAGSNAEAQQILSAPLFSAQNLSDIEQTMANIKAARSDMPKGKIAAGVRHTVGVARDGSVLVAGDNSYGQINVGGWNNIKEVAAGSYHTVALRADGTVLATGDNSQGQCDVSGWTDIVSIAAGAADTIGMKADGSVVACGKNSAKVSGWHGVTMVTGGSYSMGCIYDKGSMLSSHKSAQMDMGVVLYDLSVCGPVSAGVMYDGTMICSFDGAPAWSDMVSVTACETGLIGINSDGQVISHFYRPGDAVEMAVPGRAVEVESSGTHHVVLAEDGKVYAFGNNDYGQCGVSGWQL